MPSFKKVALLFLGGDVYFYGVKKNALRKHIILLLFIVNYTLASSQSIAWQWVHSGGGPSASYSDAGYYVRIGSNNHIFCQGLAGPIFLDQLYTGGRFIAEYTTDGTCIKTVFFKGDTINSQIFVQSMEQDPSGNLIISGILEGIASIGDTSVAAISAQQSYVAKLDSNLHVSFYRPLGGECWNTAASADKNGNIYLAGSLSAQGIGIIDTFQIHYYSSDFFRYQSYFAKLDPAGSCKWVKQGFDSKNVIGALCMVEWDKIYLLGEIDTCSTYDSIQICSPTKTGMNYIARIDTEGSLQHLLAYPMFGWAPQGASFSVDGLGNSYLLGMVDTAVIISGQTINKRPGNIAAFLAKYDSNDSLLWIKTFVCSNQMRSSVKSDSFGNVYIAGNFTGDIVLGNDTITATSNQGDIFVSRYDHEGNFLGFKVVANALMRSFAQDSEGNIIITGETGAGTTYFDNIPVVTSGHADYFIAKLSAITRDTSIPPIPNPQSSITLYPNPASTQLFIQTSGTAIEQVNIYNTTGSLVMAASSLTNNQLSIVNLSQGIYIAEIKTKEGSVRKRWVKM